MPEFRLEDTIAALATPVGEGGLAVIRVSGPETFSIVKALFHFKKEQDLFLLPSHTLHFGEIRNEKGEPLDQVIISLFRAPHSYTGENVIEMSTHGGVTVSRRILDLLIQKGARHAEPGEFTKRAFLHGKMDLTQAEAVLDLIKAKSEKSLEAAVRQLKGTLSRKLKVLKDELMNLYAHMEAYLDFPDEHLEVYSDHEMLQRLEKIRNQVETLLASFKRGILLREGVRMAIVGKPNVGKSSLFNALLERDRALVSEYPGTTRDMLEEALEIKGTYIRMVDTAGLTAIPGHPLEQMGMEKTREVLKEAQLYLFLVDGSSFLEEADEMVFQEIPQGKPLLVLITKGDLPQKITAKEIQKQFPAGEILKLSARTREGLSYLEEKIADLILRESSGQEGEQITRLRHKNALEAAQTALLRSENAFCAKQSLEFVIADLKIALDALRELIGEIYSEELLDVIFSEFCIGK